jgi:ABC-type glycerol-3-phosphate transport system substrate-binding protein
MRLRRSVLALGAVGLALVACTAASARSSRAAAPSGSITFLVSSTGTVDGLLKEIPQFTKQTGIKVKVVNIDYDAMTQKETLDLRSRTGQYDVFWVEGTFLGRYVGLLKGLLPLDTYAASQHVDLGLSDISPAVRQSFSVDGHLYAMPFEATQMLMAYRTDIYKKAGLEPATTFAQYTSTIEKANKPPVYGTELMGQKGEPVFYEYLNYLWGNGGSLFNAQGAPTIDTPQAVKALTQMKTLSSDAPPDTLTFGWDEAASSFASGKVSTAILFSDQTPSLLDPSSSKVVGKWAYAPIPGKARTAFGGYGWGINAYSKNQPAALAFVKWATSRATLASLVPRGSSPPRLSVLGDAALEKRYPWLAAEKAASSRATVPTASPAYFDLVDALSTDLNSALAGSTSPAAALKSGQSAWQKILSGG